MSIPFRAEDLARLVSNVTDTMFGTTFVPGDRVLRGESLCEQMVMIHLPADPELTVVLSSDAQGGRSLAAAFLGCPPAEITEAMADDVIAELLNMVAGQLSAALSLAGLLGLPHRTTLAELLKGGELRFDEAIILHSIGDVDMGLWILEAKSHRRPARLKRD